MASEMWRSEPPDVKAYWEGMAAEESRRHKDKYPGYSYAPAKKRKRQESSPSSIYGTATTATIQSKDQTQPAWNVNLDSAGSPDVGSRRHVPNFSGLAHSRVQGHCMATRGTEWSHGSTSMSSGFGGSPHTDLLRGANRAFYQDTPPHTVVAQPGFPNEATFDWTAE
jgi:hypothetical protein